MICAECGDPIKAELGKKVNYSVVEYNGVTKYFHKEHYCCMICKKKDVSPDGNPNHFYFDDEGNFPLCKNDACKCQVCGNVYDGYYLNTKGEKCCKNCAARCEKCGAEYENYYEVEEEGKR